MERQSSSPSSSRPAPPLPPLSSLPASRTYPPSSYPPASFFESEYRVHPALIIPARRTGEIQRRLGELVFKEPKRKSVHPPDVGIDYDDACDLEGAGGRRYDPKGERKLVLARLGPAAEGDDDGDGDNVLGEAGRDNVWLDPRVEAVLSESATEAANGDGGGGGGGTTTTAPPGRRSVRRSRMKFPATPYALLTVDQVLRRIVPTADNPKNDGDGDDSTSNPVIEEVPSSFEIAGHVAHVNLRSESLPYKYLVGRAILDKNSPRIRVVVNKVGNIENEYRTFPMEIIAGEGLDADAVGRMCAEARTPEEARVAVDVDGKEGGHRSLMEVELKEHGCRFKLDFAGVYFNSRLQGEHERLVGEIVRDARRSLRKKEEEVGGDDGGVATTTTIVADAMAGVGPFAVPLTSANAPHYRDTRIVCHANDLNPASYEYLRKNAKLNRCFSDRLFAYNLDAREFVRRMNEEKVDVDHFIMNLPQLGPEFLDAFRGWRFWDDNYDGDVDGGRENKRRRPRVHVHCFMEKARPGDVEETSRVARLTRERCEVALGCPISEGVGGDEFRVRVVRDVGPRKNMLCASFLLPRGASDEERFAPPVSSGRGEGDERGSGGEKRGREEKKVDNDEGSCNNNNGSSHTSKKSK